MANDLVQMYGPAYAGILNARSRAGDREMQALQGMGMLSQMQRQQEQMKLMQQDLALKQLAEQRQRQQFEAGIGLLQGGGAPAALAQGAAQGDVGPTVTNAERMNSSSGVMGWGPDQMVGAGMLGLGKPSDFVAVRNAFLPKYETTNGAIMGGVPGQVPQFQGFAPQVSTSANGQTTMLMPDGSGGVRSVTPPGAVENYSMYRNADEAARAGRDIVTIPPTAPNMPPVMTTRERIVQGVSAPQPATAQPPGGATIDEALAVERNMLESARKRGDINGMQRAQNNIAALEREQARNPGAVGVPAGMSPQVTTEQKGRESATTSLGEIDAKRVTGFEDKIPTLGSTLRNLDTLEGILRSGNSYQGALAETKKDLSRIAQAFGLNINAEEAANTELYLARVAELLKDRLASKDYGSGNGVSNLDLVAAGRPLPEVTKTREGAMLVINALRADATRALADMQAASKHFRSLKSMDGFQFPSIITQQVQTTAPGAPASPQAPSGGRVIRYDSQGRRIQ